MSMFYTQLWAKYHLKFINNKTVFSGYIFFYSGYVCLSYNIYFKNKTNQISSQFYTFDYSKL